MPTGRGSDRLGTASVKTPFYSRKCSLFLSGRHKDTEPYFAPLGIPILETLKKDKLYKACYLVNVRFF
jgi:hypothetical protein